MKNIKAKKNSNHGLRGFIFIVCAVAAVTLAACGGGGDPNPDPGDGKVTITFDSNGGSKVDPVKIDKGARLPAEYLLNGAKTPTKDEYEFAGWNKGAAAVTNSTTFAEDATLVAQWEEADPPPLYAVAPAIHPGGHFTELEATEEGRMNAKVNMPFSANGLFSNMAKGAGVLSSKWYRVTTSKEDADAATVANPTGTVILEQTAAGTATPHELSLPFTWTESAAGTYWYYVIVTNTNDKASVQKISSSITNDRLEVTVEP